MRGARRSSAPSSGSLSSAGREQRRALPDGRFCSGGGGGGGDGAGPGAAGPGPAPSGHGELQSSLRCLGRAGRLLLSIAPRADLGREGTGERVKKIK